MADLAGEEAQVVRGEREVRLAPELVGGSRLERLDPGELIGVRVAQVGQPVHRRNPLGQEHPRPASVAERRARRDHRPIDIRLGPGRHAPDELAGGRAVDLEPGPARRLDSLAVDEHRMVGGEPDGHVASPVD